MTLEEVISKALLTTKVLQLEKVIGTLRKGTAADILVFS
jgi:imidazolonepropionase-like amidohydrolase